MTGNLTATPIRHTRLFITAMFVVMATLTGSGSAVARETTRIVVISDINSRFGSVGYHPRMTAAINRIIELAPDLVISTGDMVAGQRPSPKLKRKELEAMWERFHSDVRKPLERAGIPIVMTPGNHDASAFPGFQLERQIYAEYHRAHPPGFSPLDGGNFPFNFAANIAGTRLISLDATRPGSLPAAQLQWLAATLTQVPTIVFGHLPLQPVSIGREREIIQDVALEQLLAEHGAVTYLSGHHHAYYPGERQGINMFAMGNLGGNLRQLVGTSVSTGFSFALLELEERGVTGVRAFVGPEFTAALDHTTLPEAIGRGNRMLRLR